MASPVGPGGERSSLSADSIDPVSTKIQDEQYLRQHPEIKGVLQEFMIRVLHEQPEDIEQYAATYFSKGGDNQTLKESFCPKLGIDPTGQTTPDPSIALKPVGSEPQGT